MVPELFSVFDFVEHPSRGDLVEHWGDSESVECSGEIDSQSGSSWPLGLLLPYADGAGDGEAGVWLLVQMA